MHPAILRTVREIEYKPGWDLCIKRVTHRMASQPSERWCVYWRFPAPTDFAEAAAPMRVGRDWLLTEEPTDGEVVATAFAAALACEEHEARAAFRYQGRPVFGPHDLVLA